MCDQPQTNMELERRIAQIRESMEPWVDMRADCDEVVEIARGIYQLGREDGSMERMLDWAKRLTARDEVATDQSLAWADHRVTAVHFPETCACAACENERTSHE